MFKPFKPPLPKPVTRTEKTEVDLTVSDSEDEVLHRPYKKRKLLMHIIEDSPPKKAVVTSAVSNAPRKPLLVVRNATDSKQVQSTSSATPEGHYSVLWYVD
jgi:DNA repair and recombination protein RAD54B